MTTTVARRTGRHLRLWVGVAVAVGVLFMPGLSRTEGLTLSAAALTYVAATLTSILTLFYFLFRAGAGSETADES